MRKTLDIKNFVHMYFTYCSNFKKGRLIFPDKSFGFFIKTKRLQKQPLIIEYSI